MPSFIFSKSNRKNKKYKVTVKFKSKDKKDETYNFGDKRYGQFKDTTPLKLYSSKDHNDKKRQSSYFARHGKAKKYSAKWFSHRYLWDG